MAGGIDEQIGQHPRAQQHATRGAHCLHGIACDVEQRLNQLAAIEQPLGQARIVVAFNRHAIRRLAAQQAVNMLTEFMDVQPLLLRRL